MYLWFLQFSTYFVEIWSKDYIDCSFQNFFKQCFLSIVARFVSHTNRLLAKKNGRIDINDQKIVIENDFFSIVAKLLTANSSKRSNLINHIKKNYNQFILLGVIRSIFENWIPYTVVAYKLLTRCLQTIEFLFPIVAFDFWRTHHPGTLPKSFLLQHFLPSYTPLRTF